MIESAAMAHEPHRIAFYLYDLAAEFHALWNRGNDDAERRSGLRGRRRMRVFGERRRIGESCGSPSHHR